MNSTWLSLWTTWFVIVAAGNPNISATLLWISQPSANRSSVPSVNSGEKNLVLAVILSVIFPGLGQIYLGLNQKGILFIVGYIISAVLIFLLIGFLLVLVVWIWALVDVVQSTNAINNGEYVEDKLF